MSRVATPFYLRARFAVGLGYLAVVLIWGTTWYGVHTQVNGTAPHVAVALRLGLASLIFFAIAAILRLPLRLRRTQAAPVLFQGLCFFGLNYIAIYTASQYLTSGVLAVVFSISVPFNIAADRIINGTPLKPSILLAALIGICGIALVFGGEVEHALRAEKAWWGATLAVLAAAIVAVGNVLSSRLAASDLGSIRLNAYGLAAGTASILLWGAVSGASWSLHVTPEWTAGFAYLVLVGSVTAFAIYMKILPAVGVVAGSYIVVLSPVIAIGISAVLESFPFGLGTITGIALLLIGHSIIVTRRRS
jgi:drug/metabolite transporter (DMT)-like permease